MIGWAKDGRRRERIIADLCVRYPQLSYCRTVLTEAAGMLTRTFTAGNKLLVCGNGGSAADAEHIAGELMKGFMCPRPLPDDLRARLGALGGDLADRLQAGLPALALSGASPLATAIANDQGADLCFAQQVVGLGRPGDVLLAISTSGRSTNVLAAVQAAGALDLATIALTGLDGGPLARMVDRAVRVPATVPHLVQELHLPVYHALCAAVEAEIFD